MCISKLSPMSEKDKEFAYEFLLDRESYHSHKETSAYTIFGVEAAFFTALLTTDWYSRIASKICNPKPLLCIIVFLIWVLVHRFLRWQLINRRIAALQVGTLITALLNNLKKEGDAKAANTPISNKTRDNVADKKINYLDAWLWPAYSATLKPDVELNEYPDWFQKCYAAFLEKKTDVVTGEYFPTIGSILILVITLLYIIFILG